MYDFISRNLHRECRTQFTIYAIFIFIYTSEQHLPQDLRISSPRSKSNIRNVTGRFDVRDKYEQSSIRNFRLGQSSWKLSLRVPGQSLILITLGSVKLPAPGWKLRTERRAQADRAKVRSAAS